MNARRRRLAPTPEPLEERLALSYVAASPASVQVASVHPHSAWAVPSVGSLGDSLTDEYLPIGGSRAQARNWVEILAAAHRVNFGRFSHFSQGEPRNVGFAQDWARDTATTTMMLADQLPGLADQVARGQVRYATILIGDNDFGQFLQDAPTLPPAALPAALVQTVATAEANFDTAVNSLLAANPRVRLAVATIFDLTQTPAVRQQVAPLGSQGQLLLGLVSQAIGQYNDHIRTVAGSDPRIALADLQAQFQALHQSATDGTLAFGGTTLKLDSSGDDYQNLFVADGFHPGTIGQGIMAETFIEALDASFNARIHPLSPSAIVAIARHAHHYP